MWIITLLLIQNSAYSWLLYWCCIFTCVKRLSSTSLIIEHMAIHILWTFCFCITEIYCSHTLGWIAPMIAFLDIFLNYIYNTIYIYLYLHITLVQRDLFRNNILTFIRYHAYSPSATKAILNSLWRINNFVEECTCTGPVASCRVAYVPNAPTKRQS